MSLLRCTLKFRTPCVLVCSFCELLFKCWRTFLFWIFFSNYSIKMEVVFYLHILLNTLVWENQFRKLQYSCCISHCIAPLSLQQYSQSVWLSFFHCLFFASHFCPHHSWHALWATIRAEWSWTKPLIKESASSQDDRDSVGERTDLINKAW